MMLSFVVLSLLAVCRADLARLVNADAPNVIPGEYMAALDDVNQGLSAATLANVDIKVHNSFGFGNFRVIRVHAGPEGLQALREDNNVRYVEADCWSAEIDQCREQDSGSNVWGLTRTSSVELPVFEGGIYNWLAEEDGTGVDAYVIDTGIYVDHNDFGGRASHGYTDETTNEDDLDRNGHGTHVAGTIGGTEYGVAKGCNLIAVKVLNSGGSGTASGVARGVDYVANRHGTGRKSVMNLSLGFSPPSDVVEDAINAAVDEGVNGCVSARNNNRDSCVDSPSRLESVITCAASDNEDNMASFTNYGPCVDIIAPGVNVRSADIGGPDDSSLKSGTSMSAPHAAGWVARYLSSFGTIAYPEPAEVMAAMKASASKEQVNLVPPKDETPNDLLFGDCDSHNP